MKQGDFHYRAFISYSHADRRVAEWLHRALEGYRIPSKLVGTETVLGPVPARLGSLFRDRDELPAAGDLSVELTQALKRSMFLIVICSPAAAQSQWVNEEVRQFKLLQGRKRGDGTARVLALIANGDPGDPGGGACFPPALKFHVLPDGSISDDPAEPIAADIRPGGDGKKLAKLKLVAGLTGLPLDALVQREALRRQRRAGVLAGASLLLAGVMAVLTVLAVQGRREADRQRAQADGLVEYMLTDLREKLEPVGRLEVLDSVGQRALAYYAAQNISALDPDELGRRARALHLVGEVRDLRGDSEGALKAFREAERTTAEQLARDPDDPDRMFDHAQSVFYVGQTAWARKDWPTTEAKFRAYVNLADRMAATDPKNEKWQLEQGYAANSLGALLLQADRAEEAIPQFQRYLAVSQALADRAPDDRARQRDSGQAHAWLSDAMVATGRLSEAEIERQAELAAYSQLLADDSRDLEVGAMMGRANDALSEIALLNGDIDRAVERGRVAVGIFRPILAHDPDNRLVQELAVNAANRHSEALLLAGRLDEAAAANMSALSGARALVRADPARVTWRTSLWMPARWMEVAIAFAQGRGGEGQAALSSLQRDFSVYRDADVDAGIGNPWVVIGALRAAERLSAGDVVAARRHATEADRATGRTRDAREAALLAELSRRIPGLTLPQRGLASAYPAAAFLDAVMGAGQGTAE